MARVMNQPVPSQSKQQEQKETKLAIVDPDRMLRSDEVPVPKYFINYVIGTLALLVVVPILFITDFWGAFAFDGKAWKVALLTGVLANGIVCFVLTVIFGRAELPKRR